MTKDIEALDDGFTLVELMVVIAILGLLATFVVLNVLPAQTEAERTKAKADIATIEQGLQMYRIQQRRYPTTAEGLAVLDGTTIQRLPVDPWGNPYQYAAPGRAGPFDIYSYGADGVQGGEDENADIGNWES